MELDGERVEMPEVVERKFKGDKVKLDILRDKRPMTVNIELGSVWPYSYLAHAYDVAPRYVVYGGLLFQPLTLDLMEAYQPTESESGITLIISSRKTFTSNIPK